MIKKALLSTVFALLAMTSFGQTKVAHINTTELLQMMPEVKQIDSTLQKMQTNYQTELNRLQQEMQGLYNQILEMSEDVNADAGILELKQNQLQKKQTEYQESQQFAQQQLQKKQQELYEPLTNKVKAVIEEVAKAKGYTHVIDSSQGLGLIWGADSHDLMPAVKAKLGIQ
jgi:outer membrane protein